jgi:hypothetical protein
LLDLEFAQAQQGVHPHGHDFFRLRASDFLDLHAAGGGGDNGRHGHAAVQEDGEVKLALNRGPFLEEQEADLFALGPRLVGDEGLA